MSDALKELLAKVEAGAFGADDDTPDDLWGVAGAQAFWAPYDGSLDAAKALHEALLPGWDWLINSRSNYAHVWQKKEVGDWNVDAQSLHSPARAWLIAILKAKIAESEDECP